MAKRMLIDALHPEETRVVIADHNQIYDFDFVSTAKKQLKGNIYLAKITRVEPSLQAAFVEYGGGKQGFLPFSEIHADYYQIPVSDRIRLMEEAARELEEEDSEQPTRQDRASDAATTGEMFATDAPQGENTGGDMVLEETFSTELPLAPAIDIPETTINESDDERPAYMMEAATDQSVSEPVEMPDLVEGHDPIGAVPSESEAFPAGVADIVEGGENAEAKSSDAPPSEEVETIEDEEYQRPKRNLYSKRYKIQEVIRRGQIVLVQVIKEERGNKGVSLTTYLSLAGRYCVLMPNSPKDGGISRKIASAEDRKRLKAIATELRLAQGMSVIVRTAGMDRTRAEIKRDFDYLVKLWNMVRDDTLKSTAPALIYEESDIIKRAIRDQYTNDIDEIQIEGEAGYRTAKDFMKMLLPSHLPKIKHYKEATPLFYAYNIEEQLLSMHEPIVKLRSGGYIVINPTEALISIDVNSGRSTGERNIEETAAKTNLEAAQEVARQLRLRDLAGLIVIDFIDMLESRNRRAVEKTLKDSLKADRAKIQLGRISPFGLLEMSRQRLRPSISETNMVQCPHCEGRGYIRSNESMSIQVIRSLEKEASSGSWGTLRVIAPQNVALHLLNTKRDVLRGIEERYGITVSVTINPDHNSADFTVEKMRRGNPDREQGEQPRRGRGGRDRGERGDRPRHERPEPEAPVAASYEEADSSSDDSGSNITEVREEGFGSEGDRGPRNRGRRRRGGRRDRGPRERPAFNADNNNEQAPVDAVASEAGEAPAEATGEQGTSDRPRNPRQRGGRGRRRWRDGSERAPRDPNAPQQDSSGNDNSNSRPDASVAAEPRMPSPPVSRPHLVQTTQLHSSVTPPIESSPRDPNAPPKKGWWKKMIELDS